MAARAVVLALLVLGTSAAGEELQDAKNRPVTKVINLLKDMLKQMEKEGEEDEEIYEKFGCWCVTYEKEKTASIAAAQNRITEKTASIEALAGDSARLKAEVGNLKKELEDNTNALGEATELRTKQSAEFNTEEKETLQSITSVKGAIQTLSKVHSGAFLQMAKGMAKEDRLNVAATVRRLLHKHQSMFAETISPHQRKVLEQFASFFQQPDGYFDASPVALAQYNPASSAIFGILKQMKEDFETNLAKSSKEESDNVKAYGDLKTAKESEIAAAEDLVETKSVEFATADEKKAADKADLEDTRATLASDQKFLSDLQLRCQDMDSQFEARTTIRQQETQAVSKALEFLSSDEAHDLFTRTFNPALLQKSRAASKQRAALSKLFQDAGKKANDPRLSALAVRARLDAFEEVKNTIKMMMDKLLKEKEDDVHHKDYCIDEFNKNDVDTANKYRERDQTVAEIDDLGMTVDELDKAIVTLKEEIVELQVAQKSASANREKANTEFQATVADQRATQKLLTAALGVLKSFYEKAALVQKSAGAAKAASKQPPPPGFKNYETSAASGGVMGMMEKIIGDAKDAESEALRSEEEEQAAFESFTKDTTESIATKTKDIVNKSEEKAQAEKDKIAAEVSRDTILSEIEQLEQVSADLHKSCDFLMKNFDLRVTARDAEVEALKQGLALFSGASFGAFLQGQ